MPTTSTRRRDLILTAADVGGRYLDLLEAKAGAPDFAGAWRLVRIARDIAGVPAGSTAGERRLRAKRSILLALVEYVSGRMRRDAERLQAELAVDVFVKTLAASARAKVLAWRDRAGKFLRRAFLAGALALVEPMTDAGLEAVKAASAVQMGYLGEFADEVIAGGQSYDTAGLAARAASYSGGVWSVANKAARANAEATGAEQERRVLGGDVGRHCPDCPRLAALGWVPIGTLPAIGEVACLGNCRCWFEHRGGSDGATTVPPPTTPGSPRVFGPSLAQVAIDPASRAEIDSRSVAMFGRALADREYSSLAGAPHDTRVTVEKGVGGEITVRFENAHMVGIRDFRPGPRGPVVRDDSFFIDEAHRGKGIGAEMLGRQAEFAAAIGVDRIVTHAQGGGMNGYYTWPRLGYDGKIPARLIRKLPAGHAKSRKISDLMKDAAGRDWWKQNGESVDVSFDPRPGGLSRRVLDAYHAAKAAVKP